MAKNNYLNILLISGSGIIGGLLNYIYHPIMLRYLSIEQFGKFGSLVAVFNILGIFILGFVLFLNKEVSKNISNKNKIKHIFISSFKLLGILGILIYFIYIIFSSLLSTFLKVDIKLIWIVGVIIIFSFLWAGVNAVLRGLKKFEIIGFTQVFIPFLKLVIGVFLVYIGYGIYGAIFGFILSGGLGVFISYIIVYKYLKKYKNVGTDKELLVDLYKNKKSLFNFFLVSFLFSIFMNIDVILAKNIFDEITAGIYAGIAVLGKFLIFLLLSIETVYYSQIMEHKKNFIPKYLIKNSIILMSIGVILAIIVNLFIGKILLYILKPDLVPYFHIYLLTLFYYGLIAFISFFSKLLIAWGNYYINYIILALVVILIYVTYKFGSTNLENFVYVFIILGLVSTLILSFFFFKELKNLK